MTLKKAALKKFDQAFEKINFILLWIIDQIQQDADARVGINKL